VLACIVAASQLVNTERPEPPFAPARVPEDLPAERVGALPAKKVPKPLTAERVGDILFECASEAVLLAFMVPLLGGWAVDLVGDILRDMTPSLPAHAHRQLLEAEPSPAWNAVGAWLREHRFAILFALFFVAKSATRLIKHSSNEKHRRAAALTSRILRAVSEDWFSLVVVNAFTAFWLTMVVQWTQGYSWKHFLWQVVADQASPAVQELARIAPGSGLLRALFAWYQANQVKFTFWLLYSAAICDDLGLPNYKSLWRWFRRRLQKRFSASRPSGQTPPAPQPCAARVPSTEDLK
jgi:hypothetical protein